MYSTGPDPSYIKISLMNQHLCVCYFSPSAVPIKSCDQRRRITGFCAAGRSCACSSLLEVNRKEKEKTELNQKDTNVEQTLGIFYFFFFDMTMWYEKLDVRNRLKFRKHNEQSFSHYRAPFFTFTVETLYIIISIILIMKAVSQSGASSLIHNLWLSTDTGYRDTSTNKFLVH